MTSVSIRKARQDDFPKISNLLRSTVDDLLKKRGFYETSPFASSRQPPPPPQQTYPWFDFGLKEDPEGFYVAESGDEIAGISLSWVRGSLWYLAHLFISPNNQGLNIGQKLLDRAWQNQKEAPITIRALATFAYNPVSISLYVKYGMYPRDPLYFMEGTKQEVKTERTATGIVEEKISDFGNVQDKFSRIDQATLGYPRNKNHEFLTGLPNCQGYIFSEGHEPVGYSYVWKSGRIGPLAATSHAIFPEIVKASLQLAAQQEGPNIGMLVTGSNDTLMKIAFDLKMRILDNFLFMSSKPFPNFNNYIVYPTGAML